MPSNLYRRGDTYYARYSVRGELQRVSLRTGDLRIARARLKAIRERAEDQAFGIEDAKTWGEAVIAYCIGVLDAGSVKPGTAKRYRVSLGQLLGHFKTKSLPLLTVADIGRYVTDRQKEGATNATIRRDLTAMSRVLAFARGNGLVQTNVVDAYDRSMIRERRAPIQAPPDEAVEAGVAVAMDAGDVPLAAVLRFLRATGMRAGEALRARWENLDGTALTIHETKSGRVRTVAVPPGALPVPPDTRRGRIFSGLPETSGALASRWQWVRRALPERQRFRLHDLRHAYAIAEIRRGRDIYDLSHHLGHSSVKVTEIYLGYAAGRRATGREDVARQMTHHTVGTTQKPLDDTP